MSRNRLLVVATVLGAVFSGARAHAVELISQTSSITSIGQTFSFDFKNDPNFATVTPTSALTGVAVDWTFTPAAGASGSEKLIASLVVPALGGDDMGVGFSAQTDLAAGPSTGYAANLSSTQLVFSPSVISQLLSGNGTLSAALSVLNTNIPALNNFFTGVTSGSITARMHLFTEDRSAGGGGGQVPEPASMLVWGLVGAGVLARKRLKARKSA